MLHVCGLCPETRLAPFPSTKLSKPSGLRSSAAELWSSVTWHLCTSLQEGCYPSRYPIAATSLTAAVRVNKHQAPLVLRRYCCRALGAQKTDDAQMLPTSAGAVKPLQSELELTVQPLQIFGCSLRTAALLPLFFFSSSISPPSLTPARSFSSAELSLAPLWPQGGIQRRTAVCAGEEGERQGKKSWLRALVMCSVVVALSSRRDPACLLRSRITHSLSVLLRAHEHHLRECRNTERAMTWETTEMLGNDLWPFIYRDILRTINISD